jgi:polyisoprenoid-binding protein YceI
VICTLVAPFALEETRGVHLQTGSHRLGPDDATVEIRTYREGMASKAGHDLIIELREWDATLALAADSEQSSLAFSADPRSLHVRDGLHGLKPLSDKDRDEIRKNIDEKVLGGHPISFRSRRMELAEDGRRLSVHGDLTMAGATRPITAELDVAPGGRVTGTLRLTQSEWGIKPYRGLMGALRVRDSVEVLVHARLPSA